MLLPSTPHRRMNPLTGEWVLVSPHRTARPWQGQRETREEESEPRRDPSCYLCPGGRRASGAVNPEYTGTFVFDNDFPALLTDGPEQQNTGGPHGMLRADPVRGICRVLCYSPRHDLSISRMDTEAVAGVVDTWVQEYRELGSRDDIAHVQIFENRGAVMGCSNPHPHGQIWAEDTVPDIPARELVRQGEYYQRYGSPLLLDYLGFELDQRERIVCENDSFVAVVPFWAVWPYEILVLPRREVSSLAELARDERRDLADIIRRTAIRYDNLFMTAFPYSMGIHQLPTDGRDYPGCQLHLHFLPPLLRSATVKKFMVGYELLARSQRDIPAEAGAAALRTLSEVHYREQ
jgi:UDPglucose--hexose-1-phosphate uridylyltransferase